ncbi:MAG: hypothetical protein KAS96_03485 [Planctomycetes bacterium]|nr:hypothetical protein [Planctomycetota bacterium]
MNKLPKTNLIYRAIARDIMVFAALWLYLWLLVDIKLIYHGAGRIVNFPTFLCARSYFQAFLVNPAGLAGYVSSFLSQMFYYSWLGSAVVSLVCWINAGLTVNILHRLDLGKFDFLRFSSVIFVAITFALYQYQFDFVVAMMVVLVATSVFLRLSIKNFIADFIFLIVLSSFLYIAAGGSFYIFAFVAFTYLIAKGRLKIALSYSAIAALTPYLIGYLIFKENLHNAYCCLTPFYWKTVAVSANKTNLIPAYILYLSLPLAACLVLIKLTLTKKYPYLFLKKTPSGKSSKLKKKLTAREKILSLLNQKVTLKYFLVSLLWIIIFALISFRFYKAERTEFFRADYYYSNRNWQKVIDIARNFTHSNYYITHAANHAFSQTDRLTTEMFTLPQHPHSMFLSAPDHIDIHWPKIDLYLDLGFLNLAEHEIAESIEAFGSRPVLLRRLITVFLAKKDYQVATVYLNQLTATVFERSWANDYLARLKSDPDMENDSRIQYLRSVMMKKNYGFLLFEYDEVLIDLLDENPKNKIAFEYLMAWYLLSGNLEKVVSNFDLMDNFDYKTFPEYYQQAYLFYTGTMRKKASLKGRKIDPAVLKSFNEIVANFNLMRKGDTRAFELLSTEYNHSYLVYYFSLVSIMGK